MQPSSATGFGAIAAARSRRWYGGGRSIGNIQGDLVLGAATDSLGVQRIEVDRARLDAVTP